MAQDPNQELDAASAPTNSGSVSSQGETQVANTSEGSQPLLTREQLEADLQRAHKKAQETVVALSPEERRADTQIKGTSPSEAMQFLENLEGGSYSDEEGAGEPVEANGAQDKKQTAGKDEQQDQDRASPKA